MAKKYSNLLDVYHALWGALTKYYKNKMKKLSRLEHREFAENNRKASKHLWTCQQADLIRLMIQVPNLFKDFVIWEYEGVENFDVGVKECWLMVREGYYGELNYEHYQKSFMVSGEKPTDKDGWHSIHFDSFLLAKATDGSGNVLEELSLYPVFRRIYDNLEK